MSYNHPHNAIPVHKQLVQTGQSADPHHQYAPPDSWVQPGESSPYGVESWFNFRNSGYIKGFVVGAGLALVLTNPAVQKAMVSAGVRLWSTVQGGVEEVKEQIQDVKAEMSRKS
jgi:hypothetical protein